MSVVVPHHDVLCILGACLLLRAHHYHHHHHHHHQSLNREGRWGTTDDFATSFLHFSLPKSRPVHFLMLSSHLFLCLPCPHSPLTVPWFGPDLMNRRHDHTTAVSITLQWSGGQEVFVWSNCLLDLGTDFLVGNMVLV